MLPRRRWTVSAASLRTPHFTEGARLADTRRQQDPDERKPRVAAPAEITGADHNPKPSTRNVAAAAAAPAPAEPWHELGPLVLPAVKPTPKKLDPRLEDETFDPLLEPSRFDDFNWTETNDVAADLRVNGIHRWRRARAFLVKGRPRCALADARRAVVELTSLASRLLPNNHALLLRRAHAVEFAALVELGSYAEALGVPGAKFRQPDFAAAIDLCTDGDYLRCVHENIGKRDEAPREAFEAFAIAFGMRGAFKYNGNPDFEKKQTFQSAMSTFEHTVFRAIRAGSDKDEYYVFFATLNAHNQRCRPTFDQDVGPLLDAFSKKQTAKMMRRVVSVTAVRYRELHDMDPGNPRTWDLLCVHAFAQLPMLVMAVSAKAAERQWTLRAIAERAVEVGATSWCAWALLGLMLCYEGAEDPDERPPAPPNQPASRYTAVECFQKALDVGGDVAELWAAVMAVTVGGPLGGELKFDGETVTPQLAAQYCLKLNRGLPKHSRVWLDFAVGLRVAGRAVTATAFYGAEYNALSAAVSAFEVFDAECAPERDDHPFVWRTLALALGDPNGTVTVRGTTFTYIDVHVKALNLSDFQSAVLWRRLAAAMSSTAGAPAKVRVLGRSYAARDLPAMISATEREERKWCEALRGC